MSDELDLAELIGLLPWRCCQSDCGNVATKHAGPGLFGEVQYCDEHAPPHWDRPEYLLPPVLRRVAERVRNRTKEPPK